MNYYERVQKSIDYIEANLENKISISRAAQTAFMSVSNFYRMFFSLTGYTVKNYIRCRRISLAAPILIEGSMTILSLALTYDYESGDSFSRAFKRTTGLLPSDYKTTKSMYYFERINLMDKYFEIQNTELLEKYPDIKVLKEMEPIRTASFCYFGKDPETHAFQVMTKWVLESGLNINKDKLRIFGFNNPSPSSPDQLEYGYEVCVTLDKDFTFKDSLVKEKILEGGLYAVTNVRRNGKSDFGDEIANAWKRFNSWLKDSKYIFGSHQWLEEHLGFDDNASHTGGIDLYMPLVKI
ncbi:AraC family transcriptional regulator [Anaerocolumna cellulosilytica]|uniref:AraC family transcriptional regulator n=1 Tax=Anaerocolumna cellulosilytica TaxID=433286 RepID=A0A6S6QTZ6_9FIRM|nr:helix-turn-helix domain-containing protein [Anaerocolumna cellulosilytica]MBB5194933.1 AraC-like DNA-binding protein/DNA gyrase inhibitor GyrI [Anaerocolumna cellulosilytica]BCJ94104.1 AraC family transcriptional regulator [Anaerocolumna cellulosilytica]